MALRWKDGDGWGEWTWSDYADRACRLAASLAALGVVPGERVVLMMRNRPEFNIADMATVLLGATPVSIYNSSAPEQVQYLASHCGAVVAIVEDVDYLERILKVRDEIPTLEHIASSTTTASRRTTCCTWDALLDVGTARPRRRGADRASPTTSRPIIYTSGTTGPPRA